MGNEKEIHAHRLDRTLFAHTELFFVAEDALARSKESSSRADLLTAMVMAAFAFEAYLNFAGETTLPYWKEIDRIPVRSKLNVLCQHVGYSPSFGERPYQSLLRLWQFRNSMAHARTETLSVTRDGAPSDPPDYPETDWEQQCDLENVTRVLEDVRNATLDLHKRLGMRVGVLGQIAVQGGELLKRQEP